MKREHKQEVKMRLLKAGLRYFTEHGYAGATVREICEMAESNIAAINYYFGDKLGFYAAVIEYGREKLHDALSKCWEIVDTQPWEALKLHINVMLSSSYDETMSQINWLFFRELVDSQLLNERFPTKDSQKHQEYVARMIRLLKGLLGPQAATEENCILLRYTYYSLCSYLPIQTYVEKKFLKNNASFHVQGAVDQGRLTDYIYGVVKRTVEDMQRRCGAGVGTDGVNP